jgi:carboxylesterase
VLPAARVDPARSFDAALARIDALRALDGPEILPQARTTLLHHGERTPLAVVLLHGFTNHPGQYREFAPLVFERETNVLIPRLPEHGDRDRMTKRLKRLTAEMLIERTVTAVDAACGLGERVAVLGISSSGLLACYLAQFRSDILRAIAVAPEFALLDLSRGSTRALALAARILPNAMLWWDPRVKNEMHPLTAYPRFSTRALAQTLRLADEIEDQASRTPLRSPVRAVVNPADPAVNNAATGDAVATWRRSGSDAEVIEIAGLPRNHDIIEPDNPKARTALVYPRLLSLLFENAADGS